MSQSTTSSVGRAALFGIVFGAVGALGAWIAGGGLQPGACILAGLVMAAIMFFIRLAQILAAARR
ncbi:hypothetical protein SBI_09864 [Streptomyces bingchenggensis BCW-1]|uniref:Uncharacterized protein n=1 Tax=Streptomyces bingchenggensis (strain BCW-1) TaxID=749414 RepID=D7CDE0_STRBB|nr:hypothetical protein SBI_09864 [Streptomyces bingchenggensis BCW-1]